MPIGTALGAIGGAVGGLAKGIGGAQREAKERQLAADTQRYSPWTGLQAKEITHGNVVGDVLGGATGGAAAAQAINQGAADLAATKQDMSLQKQLAQQNMAQNPNLMGQVQGLPQLQKSPFLGG